MSPQLPRCLLSFFVLAKCGLPTRFGANIGPRLECSVRSSLSSLRETKRLVGTFPPCLSAHDASATPPCLSLTAFFSSIWSLELEKERSGRLRVLRRAIVARCPPAVSSCPAACGPSSNDSALLAVKQIESAFLQYLNLARARTPSVSRLLALRHWN